MSDKKEYLGDGVYVDLEHCDGTIRLTTEDGIRVGNEIFIDAAVWKSLLRWVEKLSNPPVITVSLEQAELITNAPDAGVVAYAEVEWDRAVAAAMVAQAHTDESLRLANEYRQRLAAAEALLGRTADGVAFGHGSKVYYQDPVGYVQGLDVSFVFRTDSSNPEIVYHPYPVFSSHEAAAKGGRE